MMKKFTLKTLLAMLVTCSAILLKPQSSLAQVNTSLLIEVVKSCQQDALSSKYYENMGIDFSKWGNHNDWVEPCIRSRYHYSLVLSMFPWLSSTSEMFPGYRGDVATSLMPFISRYDTLNVLNCLISQDPSSQDCKSTAINILSYYGWNKSFRNIEPVNMHSVYLVYTCPSCVIAYDDIGSTERMKSAFIKWFLALDKPKRREIMFILGDEPAQRKIRNDMGAEVEKAANKYQEIRQRVQQQEQDQRRREVLGE